MNAEQTAERIGHLLAMAATEYDRKQASKRSFNHYALGQYLARIAEIRADIANGAAPRAAIVAGFSGRLLDVCLKAVGELGATDSDQRGGCVYQPTK